MPSAAASQYRKASFLLNAAGQEIFPTFLQMQERPHILKGLASAAFDGEGAATHDRDLVRDGVLQGYVLGSYSARKLGLKTTGNAGGIHNLIIAAPGKALDMESFLTRMQTGLLVTEMMGQGVNGVTGDYSRGASGFWVENGAIAFPVHEVTIAGNLKQMYRDIVALGNDIDVRGGIRTGSVLIGEMTIAGKAMRFADSVDRGQNAARTLPAHLRALGAISADITSWAAGYAPRAKSVVFAGCACGSRGVSSTSSLSVRSPQRLRRCSSRLAVSRSTAGMGMFLGAKWPLR